MRLLYTLCRPTINALLFSAIFWAVPALSRVLPEMISGPVSSVMPISASTTIAACGLFAKPIVSAPARRAAQRPKHVWGTPRCRNRQHHIVWRGLRCQQVGRALLVVVLGAFNRLGDGGGTSRQQGNRARPWPGEGWV